VNIDLHSPENKANDCGIADNSGWWCNAVNNSGSVNSLNGGRSNSLNVLISMIILYHVYYNQLAIVLQSWK